MKKIISGIIALSIVAVAVIYAKNTSEVKTSKANCPNTPDCVCTK